MVGGKKGVAVVVVGSSIILFCMYRVDYSSKMKTQFRMEQVVLFLFKF